MESYSDACRAKQLIYGGEILSEEDYDSLLETIDDFPRDVQHGCRKPSLYLQLFEDMINTVYEHEYHLLSQNEWDVFATLKYYCYNARYCLVRLVLRKPDQWHALSSLGGYKKEVGEVGLIRAITDLCRPWHEVMNGAREEPGADDASGLRNEAQEVVDLVSDSHEEVRAVMSQHNNAEAGPSNTSTRSTSTLSESDIPILDQSFQDDLSEVQLDSFCYDESTMDITELLNRLSVKQLKGLVKETKSRPSKSTKPEMIRALLNNATTQSVLQLPLSPMNERLRRASEPCLRQATSLADVKTSVKGKEKAVFKNQEQRLVQMVLKIFGKCVKVNGDFYRLVRRLHLICFRCTEQPTSLLLPALLTSFKKRTYPRYQYKRDKSIWPTREDLMAYEAALELELYLEEVMTKLPEKGSAARTPAPLGGPVAPTTPIGQILRTPKTPLKTPKDPPLLDCNVKEEAQGQVEDVSALIEVIDVEEEDANIQKAKRVKELLYDKIYPRWREFIEAKSREGCSNRNPGLERFEPGYIYTRMLHHALRSLATLKAYQAEHEILQALLGQDSYRRGSRARWYERRAILEMTQLSKADGGKRDQDVLWQAMNGVKEALLDEDTGIVWRPGLFRRLQRLEKMLQVPEEERTPLEWELKQPQKVFVKAVRAIKRSNSMPVEDNGRSASAKGDEAGGLHAYFTPKKNVAVKVEDSKDEAKDNSSDKVITRDRNSEAFG
ncbi:hypothetical protein AX14_007863 [Amanita brunnescens Koide BX004]|nr:hypothetical protein AX14_007863 [Amanita brunnescens Koide BX004]